MKVCVCYEAMSEFYKCYFGIIYWIFICMNVGKRKPEYCLANLLLFKALILTYRIKNTVHDIPHLSIDLE